MKPQYSRAILLAFIIGTVVIMIVKAAAAGEFG